MDTTYKIHWTSGFYWSPEEFNTMEDAIDYGKSKHFEFTVHKEVSGDPLNEAGINHSVIVAGWQVFRGLVYYEGVE